MINKVSSCLFKLLIMKLQSGQVNLSTLMSTVLLINSLLPRVNFYPTNTSDFGLQHHYFKEKLCCANKIISKHKNANYVVLSYLKQNNSEINNRFMQICTELYQFRLNFYIKIHLNTLQYQSHQKIEKFSFKYTSKVMY